MDQSLKTRLRWIADAWTVQWGHTDASVSLRTLGRKAVGNALVFEREDMTLSTCERLLDYLGDATNWPAGLVPRGTAAQLGTFGRSVPAEAVFDAPVVACG